jgi:hypothetical protein
LSLEKLSKCQHLSLLRQGKKRSGELEKILKNLLAGLTSARLHGILAEQGREKSRAIKKMEGKKS